MWNCLHFIFVSFFFFESPKWDSGKVCKLALRSAWIQAWEVLEFYCGEKFPNPVIKDL